MQLEFHQLDRRWEHLRVRHPGRQRRLLASLADSGQQTPIVVVAAEGQADRYVVIDGYKRIAALEQLGRDTVEAVVWPRSEAAAVVLDRSLRLSEHETALEVGWLLAELERRFDYGLDELKRRSNSASSQPTSSAVSCSLNRSERSSTTAAASLLGHTTASTVSRPSCSSAAMRL